MFVGKKPGDIQETIRSVPLLDFSPVACERLTNIGLLLQRKHRIVLI